jgi:chemotaxis regulatin CheY-phosphate phosphatase CheZ
MPKPINIDKSGDSAELQALFDAIAAGAPPAVHDPMAAADASGDNDELQALFDSVATKVATTAPVAAATKPPGSDEAVFDRFGQLLRQLHDDLRNLGDGGGYDQAAGRSVDAVDLVRGLEIRLLRALTESMPAEREAAVPPELLSALRHSDRAMPQEQVDELLRSLGF